MRRQTFRSTSKRCQRSEPLPCPSRQVGSCHGNMRRLDAYLGDGLNSRASRAALFGPTRVGNFAAWRSTARAYSSLWRRVTAAVRARMPLPDERATLQLPDATPILHLTRVTHGTADRALILEELRTGQRPTAVYEELTNAGHTLWWSETDSPGERRAPCSLAPWQLPPKVSPADDVPTRAAHLRKRRSSHAAVSGRKRLQKTGQLLHLDRPPRQPDDAPPSPVGRGHRTHTGQLEPDSQKGPVQPVCGSARLTPPLRCSRRRAPTCWAPRPRCHPGRHAASPHPRQSLGHSHPYK
ncbi:hypothetical protein SVIOM74S_04715 [Streptomyces violarus]